MSKAFDRLAESVLRRLGQDAFLHSGTTTKPCRVNVERGVLMAGYYQDAMFHRDIVTLDSTVGAQVGDRVELQATGAVLVLDAVLADSGRLARFTVQPHT